MMKFDAFFFVSFGGPEGPDEVMPFLNRVLAGKNVPEERKLEVAAHYQKFGGISPINEQNRTLIKNLKSAFEKNNIDLPMYWGNRNSDPLIQDTIEQMRKDKRSNVLCFFTSSFSSYSGCRQYRENIEDVKKNLGLEKMQFSKLRTWFNHPLFIQIIVEDVQKARSELVKKAAKAPFVLFTAHSIPQSMSKQCDYVVQLKETSQLVTNQLHTDAYRLVFQSRSGPPQVPWLEPDICDALDQVKEQGHDAVIVVPIGFVTDHMEVKYDLDVQAKEKASLLDLSFVRVQAPGHNPRFIDLVVDLVLERVHGTAKKVVGTMKPGHDQCPIDCCRNTR
ncbi:MAG: ferrochelatase [Bdellovibrionales bacterium]|nr:ferrochelatase [Bdellovibrionales bacterium]